MRILQVNKFNYPRAGAEKYFLSLSQSLIKAGHQVAIFAMDHPENLASSWKKYFVSNIDFNSGSFKDQLRAPKRIIYCSEAKIKFSKLIDDFKPNLIHCHNIYHQLSPSILEAAKRKNIPVIMHLHDYKLICPNYRLFSKNKICFDCLTKKNYLPVIKNNCYESFPRSTLAYLEMTLHNKIWKIYQKNLNLLIAPSRFIQKLFINNGWPKEKVVFINNPAPGITKPVSTKTGEYFLYFGRLAPEKGIEDLIAALKNSNLKLEIAGSGPSERKLKKLYAAEIKSKKIVFIGQLAGKELIRKILTAKAVVIPSRWLENMPLSLLESLALGKIVIASRLGGLPEIIKNGVNGYLFKPGDILDLRSKLELINNLTEKEKTKIETTARKTAAGLNPKDHLAKILNIYQKLAKKSA